MALLSTYFDYLAHFETTVTLVEHQSSSGPEIALRHDIDHCIDTALEMAFWESENNLRASYFILNTAPYRDDPQLMEKCLQLQKFGHEVGIHTNSITKWFKTGKDPFEDVRDQVTRFRNSGIDIYGTSAHGDRNCYEENYINYWIFNGLKPENIIEREACLNAEGIFEPDIRKRIKYPESHQLIRADGLTLELWENDEKKLGLIYEASHIKSDLYFTDSGGTWKRSPDPIKQDLRNKRVQVLIHPIHWRAPRKIYFFMSTARSGSKWLSKVLDEGSSCSSVHEYTLNHYTENLTHEPVEEKMTGERLYELLNDSNKIEKALEHTRNIVDTQENDFAEVNVYLPLVIDHFLNKFPDANVVHLHRNPVEVVRSIMNRGWYDTPNDPRHPANLYDGWDSFSPFKKCCCYVRFVNQVLIEKCQNRLSFEKMTTDSEYLKEQLKSIGIAFYPHLNKGLMDKKINTNNLDYFPDYNQWDSLCMNIYEDMLTKVNQCLGYEPELNHARCDELTKKVPLKVRLLTWVSSKLNQNLMHEALKSKNIFNMTSSKCILSQCFAENAEVIDDQSGINITSLDTNTHSLLYLNGGRWRKLTKGSGWCLLQNGYYTLNIASNIPEGIKASVFCLYYNKNKKFVHKRALGTLGVGTNEKIFSFASMGGSHFFNLVVYMPVQKFKREMILNNINLDFEKY